MVTLFVGFVIGCVFIYFDGPLIIGSILIFGGFYPLGNLVGKMLGHFNQDRWRKPK